MRPRKYHVTLTEEEYKYLNELTRKGTASAQKIQHAQIILKLDETFNEKPWPVESISQAYRRKGVVDFFMMFEPLTGQRQVTVRQSRTRKDFGYSVKQLVDVLPGLQEDRACDGDLNIHSVASLYESFPPEEALRLANRL